MIAMNRRVLLLLLMLALLCSHQSLRGQKRVNRSEKMKPEWVASRLPKPSNSSFYYQKIETNHAQLDEAREAALISLSTFVKQKNTIVGGSESEISFGDGGERESYTFRYQVKGEEIVINSQRLDEYWEYVTYPNGTAEYRLYTLFAISAPNQMGSFDRVTFSHRYGARGFVRSLVVPGWGQLHKGQTAKGALILGGEVLLGVGIILTESERSSYSKKIGRTQNVTHIRDYRRKMDNYETARNICIGGAAALYIYSLVDAIASDGRKRTVVGRNKLALLPMSYEQINGVKLTYNF